MPCFSQIVGQARVVEALRRSLETGRLAQAYLFSGPEGVGKRTAALALAGAVGCHTSSGEGCDRCDHCSKIASGSHPDVIVVAPDGAFIKIDQVRALEPLLAIAPRESPRRFVVIDGAERLHPSAANALLKSVEEPRGDTTFVLVASAPHRVVPTLLSRSQRLRFAPLSPTQVEQITRDVLVAAGADLTALPWAAAASEGSPGRALRFLTSEGSSRARELATAIEQATTRPGDLPAAARARPAVLPVFDAAGEARGMERAEVSHAIELLQLHLRDRLLASAGLAPSSAASLEAAGSEENAQFTDARRILRCIEAIQEAQQALRVNANAVLTLEQLGLALQEETCT